MDNEAYTYEELTLNEAMRLVADGGTVYRKWKGYGNPVLMSYFLFHSEDSYFKAVKKRKFYLSNREAIELFFDRKSFYCEDGVTGRVTKITPGLDTSTLPLCFCTRDQSYFVYN